MKHTIEVTIDELRELDDECAGKCVACGAERGGVEPDARKYRCLDCGAMAVYGAQELPFLPGVRVVGS